jgi:hypothetical protein
MAFVELRSRLQERVETYGLLTELDREHFFAKMKPALRDIEAHEPDSDEAPHRWVDALEQDSDD